MLTLYSSICRMLDGSAHRSSQSYQSEKIHFANGQPQMKDKPHKRRSRCEATIGRCDHGDISNLDAPKQPRSDRHQNPAASKSTANNRLTAILAALVIIIWECKIRSEGI